MANHILDSDFNVLTALLAHQFFMVSFLHKSPTIFLDKIVSNAGLILNSIKVLRRLSCDLYYPLWKTLYFNRLPLSTILRNSVGLLNNVELPIRFQSFICIFWQKDKIRWSNELHDKRFKKFFGIECIFYTLQCSELSGNLPQRTVNCLTESWCLKFITFFIISYNTYHILLQ